MTPAASDEILTSLGTEGERAQDDRLKNSFDDIFRIEYKLNYLFELKES